MLRQIDSSLITLSQWIVRQIELSTIFTRKHMLIVFSIPNLLLGFFCSALAIFLAITATGRPDSLIPEGFMMFFLLLCHMHIFTIACVPKIIKKQKQSNLLPEEIVENMATRYILLLLLLLSNVMFFFLPRVGENVTFEVLLYFYYVILASLASLLVLEYLFCSSPLPPEEKARKKLHREVRGMVLQKM